MPKQAIRLEIPMVYRIIVPKGVDLTDELTWTYTMKCGTLVITNLKTGEVMMCKKYIYEYDDHDIKCRQLYNSEEDIWDPIEPYCDNCGYKEEECECEEYKEAWYANDDSDSEE
jgi:hypothetical protein